MPPTRAAFFLLKANAETTLYLAQIQMFDQWFPVAFFERDVEKKEVFLWLFVLSSGHRIQVQRCIIIRNSGDSVLWFLYKIGSFSVCTKI